jgi:quinol-cytochrome oxidoreductase complex cytochrome b subunit
VILLYVLFLPFLDRSKRTHPRDRPFFIWIANSLLGFFILTTVWGGLTPGVQITVNEVILRLAPIFLVNALVIGLFHWRYQTGYKARLAAAGMAHRLSGAYPTAAPAVATRSSAPEVASRE